MMNIIIEGLVKYALPAATDYAIKKLGEHYLDKNLAINETKSIENLNSDQLISNLLKEGIEKGREIALNMAKEALLERSMKTIENNNLENLKARNEHFLEIIRAEKAEQIAKNSESGAKREEQAFELLSKEFPEDEGFKIEREQYLRDKEGKIVKDPETNEARRIDFVVIKDDKVVKSIEVTSEEAPKENQISKENRIREIGGNYIKERETGKLIEFPQNVITEIRRFS